MVSQVCHYRNSFYVSAKQPFDRKLASEERLDEVSFDFTRMLMKNDFLNDLRIASPCPVAWQDMSGTERVRFCRQCELHVYDISQLTRDETVALIVKSEGRICARLHRRADGTVITRDCPVGLRSLRKRVARSAGAVLTAILSLSASLFAQTRTPDKESCNNSKVIKVVEKQQSPDQKPAITGIVRDANGAAIPGATITLTEAATKQKFTTTTTDAGEFRFADLPIGEYTLEISSPIFRPLILPQLVLRAGETLRFDSTLDFRRITILSGIMTLPIQLEPPIYSNGTMRLSGDLIQRLPH